MITFLNQIVLSPDFLIEYQKYKHYNIIVL